MADYSLHSYIDENEFKSNLDSFYQVFESNEEFKRGLALVELIVKLLHLADVTTNGENFGYLMPEKILKIVDFIILHESYLNSDYEVYKYYLGDSNNISLKSKSCFLPIYQNLNQNIQTKKIIAKKLVDNELQEFELNLNKAECFVQDFISIKHNSVYLYQNQQEKEDDLLDLSYYVKNIKNSFDTFCKILKDL